MYTVLVVDDDPDVLDCLSAILNFSGYKVIAALDPLTALSTVAQGARVDVVVTDYWMPSLNGSAFLDRFRAVAPNIPIIVLTGCSTLDSYSSAICHGAFEYMKKPVRAAELRRVITSALTDGPSQLPRTA
jgi:DNA-binding NtrC family response regulator